MLANRKRILNILLGLGMLTVWGLIANLFLKDGNEELNLELEDADNQVLAVRERVRYTPVFDYRDPFIKTKNTTSNVAIERREKPVVRVNPELKKQVQIWPQIRYYGVIENNSKGEVIGLLEIDRKSHLLAGSSEIGNLSVKYFNTDSAVVALNSELRTFKRSMN